VYGSLANQYRHVTRIEEIKALLENLKARDDLEELGVDGKVM
jgi:hypothetical protein